MAFFAWSHELPSFVAILHWLAALYREKIASLRPIAQRIEMAGAPSITPN
jgi:hypothetical protein